MRLLIVAMSAASIATGSACADSLFEKTRHYTTAPGQEVRIGAHSNLDRKCLPLRLPNITVVEPPKHGTISTRPATYVRKGAVACEGREVSGLFVFYTPAAGFTGDDAVQYTAPYGADIQTNTVTVTVH